MATPQTPNIIDVTEDDFSDTVLTASGAKPVLLLLMTS